MVDKRNKSFIASTLVTLVIIVMLVISVPTSAVTVAVNGLSGSIAQGDSKTFTITVTLDNADKFVPISNMTLNINGPTAKKWVFDPVSGKIIDPSGDKNITVKVISAPDSSSFGYGYGYGTDTVGCGYGYNSGYGYGYNSGYGYGYNFGYGYGYGYNQGQGGGKVTFTYQVTLSTANLAEGNYTATANLNTGNPAKANFTSTAASFAVVPSGAKSSISGMKFNDSNGNGTKDAGETGLEGWIVKLIDSDGNVVNATTTDSSGNYTLSGILEGNYTVAEVIKPGWTQTFPLQGAYTVTLKPGENLTAKDFGNHNGSLGTPEISGMKFNDLNGNGIKEPEEPGLEDWLIKLTDSSGNVRTAITNSSGNYTFSGLGTGTYVVSEVLEPGWTRTLPTGGNYTLAITSGQNFTGIDFGNREASLTGCTPPGGIPGSSAISGMKFNDLNGNGTKDAGEAGLANWTIKLMDLDGNVLETTTTDANGNYTFSGLKEGYYTVGEVLEPGWTQKLPTGGIYTVGLPSNTVVTDKDFGNMKATAVGY